MMKYLVGLIVAILVATIFYNKVYVPKTTFKTIQPKIGELKVTVKGIGNVGAKNIYNITAQSGGKILKLLHDEGEWVKKGDLLIVMDGVDLDELLEVAQATLTKVKYDLLASKSELKNQNFQKELLNVTYNRYLKLKEQNFVSQAEYDKANTDLQSIKANISASLSHVNSAKAGIEIAKKNIKVIQAKIDTLKVYAPVDGYIISKEAEVSQDITFSSIVFQIVDSKTLWIKTKIDERISSSVRLEQDAIITLRSQANRVYKGKVKRVVSVSDAVTLEREIDVAFENIPQEFFINEQAEVKIAVKSYKRVVKIPVNVVLKKNDELGVWIVKDYHVKFQAVEIIAQNDDEIAISNVDKESYIIVPDKKKKELHDGMKIHL
ncbi:MAG: efflux RND transporter periplasmic adaptor subunit [Sulfurimonas sp.]